MEKATTPFPTQAEKVRYFRRNRFVDDPLVDTWNFTKNKLY